MSTLSTSFSQPHGCPSQRGVALVVGLIFLIILTLLGLGAMNTAALEEKMAFNSKDRNLAFQAAESALRVGEDWLRTVGTWESFYSGSANANGLYIPSTTGTPLSDSVNWTGSSNLVEYPNMPALSVSGSLIKIGTQPKYIIEYLGPFPQISVVMNNTTPDFLHYYRITARGTGGVNASATMVQSTYSRR